MIKRERRAWVYAGLMFCGIAAIDAYLQKGILIHDVLIDLATAVVFFILSAFVII